MKMKTSKSTRRRSADLQKRRRNLLLAGVRHLVDLDRVDGLELRHKRVRFYLQSGQVIQSQHSSVEAARNEFINCGRRLNGLRPLHSGKRA